MKNLATLFLKALFLKGLWGIISPTLSTKHQILFKNGDLFNSHLAQSVQKIYPTGGSLTMKILAVLAVLLIPPAGFAETRFVTTRASKSFTGGDPNDLTWLANTSANGQYVIFKSWASNIVSDDSNKRSDFFIFDGKTNTTKQISLPYVETEPPTTEWVYDLEDVP